MMMMLRPRLIKESDQCCMEPSVLNSAEGRHLILQFVLNDNYPRSAPVSPLYRLLKSKTSARGPTRVNGGRPSGWSLTTT